MVPRHAVLGLMGSGVCGFWFCHKRQMMQHKSNKIAQFFFWYKVNPPKKVSDYCVGTNSAFIKKPHT
jgi:hypothetical protein